MELTQHCFRRNSVNSGQPNNSSSKWGGQSPSKSGDSQKGDMPFGGNSTGEKAVAQPPPSSSAKEAKSQLLGNSLGVPEAPKPSVTTKLMVTEVAPMSTATEKPKPTSTSSPKSKAKSKEASSSKAKTAVAKAILAAETATHQASTPATPVTPTTPVTPKTPVTTVTTPVMNQSASEGPRQISKTESVPTTTRPDPSEALTPPTTESSKDKEAKLAAVGVISREIFKGDGGGAAKSGSKKLASSAAAGHNQVPVTSSTTAGHNQVTDGHNKTKAGLKDAKKAAEKANKRSPSATRRQQPALEPLKIVVQEQQAKGVPSEAAQVSVAKVKTIEPLVEDSKVRIGFVYISSGCLDNLQI